MVETHYLLDMHLKKYSYMFFKILLSRTAIAVP